jgi:hypothetical protein
MGCKIAKLTSMIKGILDKDSTNSYNKSISDTLRLKLGYLDVFSISEDALEINIKIVPYKDIQTAEDNGEGINVLRKNSKEHYGNPFEVKGINTGAIVQNAGTVEEVSDMYKAWLKGEAHTNIEPERRKWILDQIDSGKLDGTTLLYHDGTTDYNHATVLRDFINNKGYNIRLRDINLENRKEKGTVTIQKNFFSGGKLDKLKEDMDTNLFSDENYKTLKASKGSEFTGRKTVVFGPVDYTYSGVTHDAKPLEDLFGRVHGLEDALKQMNEAYGKKGYFNQVLINRFDSTGAQGKSGIGGHRDAVDVKYIGKEKGVSPDVNEAIYYELNEEGTSINTKELAGAVGIWSIGNTTGKHKFGDKDIQVPDNSFAIMSTGEIRHIVASSNGVRYSITPRHVDESWIKDKEDTKPDTNKSKTPVFDSLPSPTPGKRTMTYAGIGNTSTERNGTEFPKKGTEEYERIAQDIKEAIEYLEKEGYTLNSGGAEGADTLFESFVKDKTKKQIIIPESGHRDQSIPINERNDIVFTNLDPKHKKTAEDVAREIHPTGNTLSPIAMEYQRRNTMQVFGPDLNTPVDFVLYYAKDIDGSIIPDGSTGQAVELARRKGIPVINITNANWKQDLLKVLKNGQSKTDTKPKARDPKDVSNEEVEKALEKAINLLTESDINSYKRIVFDGIMTESEMDGINDIIKDDVMRVMLYSNDPYISTVIDIASNEDVRAKAKETSKRGLGIKGEDLNKLHNLYDKIYTNILDITEVKKKKRKSMDDVVKVKVNIPEEMETYIAKLSRVDKKKAGNIFMKAAENKLTYNQLLEKIKIEVESGTNMSNSGESGNANIDMELHKKLEKKLKDIYPEIKLKYTKDDIEHNDMDGSIMNQEESLSMKELYPGIDLDEVVSKYGIEKIREAQLVAGKAGKFQDINIYATIYIDLLEKTTQVNNTITRISKLENISRDKAKDKLAYLLVNDTSSSMYERIRNFILSFFNKKYKENTLLNIEIAALKDNFNKGINSGAIRFTPKEGFSKVDTEKTFLEQPFAADILKDVMGSVDKGEAVFTGSAALALQGDIYRRGKDGITDLHDLDIVVSNKSVSKRVANKIKSEYSTHQIYDFELPTASNLRIILDKLSGLVPKSLINNIKPTLLNKYISTTNISTFIITPKGTSVRNMVRFNSYKYSRILSYEIVNDSTKEVVGKYKAEVRQVPNSARTEIVNEQTSGIKAVVLDLLEDKTMKDESTVTYNSPTIGDVILASPADTFDAKNSLGRIPRDKDILDFNSFYKNNKNKNYGSLKDKFKGKLILANSGSGKSYASSIDSKIIDGDDLLSTILNVSQQDIVKGLTRFGRDKAYEELAKAMKAELLKGNTVVTASTHPAIVKIADMAIVQNDHYTIQKQASSGNRNNIINRSIDETKKSIYLFNSKTKDMDKTVLGSNQSVSDIIFNEYERKHDSTMFQKQQGKIKGQADLKAKTVLINEKIMTQDTLPHEYAHHYINWFRDTKIVKEGIKKWGSEEKLVQAIGEQVVEQKGEAHGWWKKFSDWIKQKFNNYFKGIDKADKEQLQKLLTDAFLTRKDLNEFEKNMTAEKEGVEQEKNIKLENEGDTIPSNDQVGMNEMQTLGSEYTNDLFENGNEIWNYTGALNEEAIVSIVNTLYGVDAELFAARIGKTTSEIYEDPNIMAIFEDKVVNFGLLEERVGEILNLLGSLEGNHPLMKDVMVKLLDQNEEGNRAVGRANITNRSVDIKLGGQTRFNSNMGVFMHEIQHILVEKALDDNPSLRKEIRQVREHVIKTFKKKGIDYRVLLEGRQATTAEIEYAKDLWNYILYNEHNPESEFLAHATTTGVFNKALELIADDPIETTLFKEHKFYEVFDTDTAKEVGKKRRKNRLLRILNGIIKVINAMYKGYMNNGKFTQVVEGPDGQKTLSNKSANQVLTDVLQLVYSKAANMEVEQLDPGKFGNDRTQFLQYLDNKLNKYTKKLNTMVYGDKTRIGTPGGVVKYLEKITDMKGLVKIKDYIRTTNLLTPFTRNSTDEILKDSNALFNLNKKLMERDIQRLHMSVINKLNGVEDEDNEFSTNLRVLDDSEKIATKEVLIDTGITDTMKDVKEIEKYLKDESLIDKDIAEFEEQIKIIPQFKLHAEALGKSLVHKKQFVVNGYENAMSIIQAYSKSVTKYMNLKTEKEFQEFLTGLDHYIGLKALKEISTNDKELVVQAIGKDSEGVQAAVDLMNIHINEAKDVFFASNDMLVPKGYSKDITDNGKVFYAVNSKTGRELEKAGFKKVRKQETLSKLENEDIFIYVGRDYDDAYTSGTLGLVRLDLREGVYLKQWLREKHPNMTEFEAQSKIATLAKTYSKMDIKDKDSILLPKRNGTNKIVDYIIDLTKKEKFDMLGLNNDIVEVVARTVSNIEKKEKSIMANKDAIDFAYNFYDLNINELGEKAFIEIRDSTEEEIRRGKPYKYEYLWKLLPKYTKDYIAGSKGGKSFKVHKDHLLNFFGDKELSLGNLIKNPSIKKNVKQGEELLTEIVSRVKRIIVPLDGQAILGNLGSNALTVMIETDDYSPIAYFKELKESWGDLERYLEIERDLTIARLEAKRGNAQAKHMVKYYERELKDNYFYDLIEAGQYNQLIEDVDMNIYEDHGEIRAKIMKQLDKAPESFKRAFKEFYVTNDSTTYKKIIKFTQYADIVSRGMLKKYYENNTNMSHRDIMAEVDAKFVNYSYLDNNVLRYINKTGIITFTKFFSRSLAVALDMVLRKPASVATSQALQWATIDLSDILDNYLANPIDSIAARTNTPKDYVNNVGELVFPTFLNIFVK